MTTKEQILEMLRNIKPTANLENVGTIVTDGYLDSMELMFTITSLEDTFGIEVSIDDISPENFNSVEAMTAMVDRLTK